MSLSLPALAAHAETIPTAITAAEFEQIMQRYQKKVYRVLLLMLKNPEDADNLTQECFLRAYMSMRSFRGECSVQTWLLRIAVNLVRDDARNRRAGFWKRLLRLDDQDAVPAEQEPACAGASAERGMIAQQQLAAVWHAVDKLSMRQKEVFILRFAEEMELKEIADVLNLRTGTVKAQLFRAVTSVREQVRR
jgi:RNA polymerase sigma-70 factor (ECF subfamily)